ncbi:MULTISPECIES: hypothetical protein [unclassified Microcystis]|uniref:hypothetical protein n=1 Tax=unclassified Microcystis TaxID=2643300 RepID=UPI002587A108|nr:MULTISPECIES: hypothetical protein [unclassified Microcystis]MCA2764843.1 hypothetical protein [Microcystis sp. M151S2]MCA2641896.1 hypothetical protein [Microcystis sp. M087S2]MCA2671198.1 hypothetical protein [Microcystis sp. M080S2]MCA2688382.1 hypothetical protein [Microcystis sp. M037S2]MCA2734731.1 hypothetical protein [Microcystis sp. M158S2]
MKITENQLKKSPELVGRHFPFLTLMLQRSPYLDRIITDWHSLGYKAAIIKSD